MPKESRNPIIIEDLLCISIRDLKKRRVFQRDRYRGEITWRNAYTKEFKSSVGIEVITNGANPQIRLNYAIDRKTFNYAIPLLKVLSNLGKSYGIWYFVCPETEKRCSKLFLLDEHFISVGAIQKSAIYRKDTKGKALREQNKGTTRVRELIKVQLSASQKGYKATYRGQPTKQALKVAKARRQLKAMGLDNLRSIRDYLGVDGE